MADLEVDRGSGLDLFLRMHGVQPWRIPIYIDCGAIQVFRDGADLPLKKGPKTHVAPGDKVRIADPLSPACLKAIQKEVDANSRDYALVPGTSPFDKVMGKLVETRPETIRIKDPSIHTLAQFLKSLGNDLVITNPIRKLIVVSHANDEGQLKITLTSGSPKFIDYEDLDAPLKSKALFLKHEWFLPRPADSRGQPIPYQLLIRGCRIGTQRVFLEKLKAVLGSRIQVIAPKHFHVVDTHWKDPKGYLEYLAYSFAAKSPTPLKIKDAVVQALVQADHRFIDKSPVPPKRWKEWVPVKPEAAYEQKDHSTVQSPIEKKAAQVPRTFRYRARDWLPAAEPLAMDKAITSDADRLNVLKPLLAKRDEFKASYPYPMYVRLGYKTFEDFIAGWTWTFKPKNKPADEVKFNATRYEYTVIQPVTEVKTGLLVLNFYPSTKKGKVIEMLDLNDPALFEVV